MAETGTLKIKNGKLEFIKFGRGTDAFVILPGLSYDGFFNQAKEIERAYGIFAEKYTVYLIGRNLKPKTGYSVKDIADDTAEAFRQLGIVNADVLGVSLGGMVAQVLAINYPKLIKKLVLSSTLSRPNETFLNGLTRWESLAKNNDICALASEFNATIYSPDTLKKYAAELSAMQLVASEEKTACFIAYVNAAKHFDEFTSLKKIKAETFVIGAQNDKITTASAAQETAKALNCRYYEYKNFGHAVFDEAPDYKERVYNFLAKK